MNEYTKGEWKVFGDGYDYHIGIKDGEVIAQHLSEANAQLIASAPKQNEAIKAMVALIVAQYPALMKSYSYELMTEALSKVEGK